jgi:uncharacterized protein YqgV (UPF0045/DUF77 family)
MRITAEMSLYPLEAEPIERIVAFIGTIQRHPRLEVAVNQMSTQIRGELDDVLGAIAAGLRESFAGGASQALVVKFLNVDLPILDPPDLTRR